MTTDTAISDENTTVCNYDY